MGHTATKPDKVNIGITKDFRDQMKKLLITKNRVVYIPRKFFNDDDNIVKCKFYKFPNKEIIIDNFNLTLLILLILYLYH